MVRPPDFLLRREAAFSECGTWRYSLRRYWDDRLPKACGLLLNPSKANAELDDPTTVQMMNRLIMLGYGSYWAANCFALVSTSPKALRTHHDPVGPENDEYILRAVAGAKFIFVAWGKDGNLHGRASAVLKLLAGRQLYCFGINLDGTPRFPRAVPLTQRFVEYRGHG